MSHSYTSSLFHTTFSTKNREKTIDRAFRYRLWDYIGGVARTNTMTPLAVGGTDDHAHVLLALPATMAIAKAIQLIKSGSSKWVNETFPSGAAFAWQRGYGAFSIGVSQIDVTIAYIENQERHHHTRSFEDEFLGFLRKHGVAFDERYVWG